MEFSAAQLASIIGGEVVGDPSAIISTYSKIEEAKKGALTFLANKKYTHYIYTTEASVVLVRKDFVPEHEIKTTLIKVEDPYATLAELLNMVSEMRPEKKGVEQPSWVADGVSLPEDIYLGAFAYIGNGAKIGNGVKIYPQCYIGDGVEIGNGTVLYSGVKIYHGCKVGAGCIIHAGCVIGSDGFGFAPQKDGAYIKISQIGSVVIEDNVEIGANTTIDRATMGATVIRKGVKLDNLIQIAHNVEVGENTVMAAQVGVAGSAKIGKQNMVGGQVGIAGHIAIGDGNQIGAQSGIHTRTGDGKILMGYPAVPARDFMKQSAYMKRLAELFADVAQIKKELNCIKDNK